jgi:hypothetical protein
MEADCSHFFSSLLLILSILWRSAASLWVCFWA